MNRAVAVILLIFISSCHIVVSAVSPSDTTFVDNSQVNDANVVITNPFFKTPPIADDGNGSQRRL